MTSPVPPSANVQDAIAVMTAWVFDSRDERLLDEVLVQVVEGHSPFEPNLGLVRLTKGLIELCGFLLAVREQETGTAMPLTLQELGRHFAGE